MMRIYSISEIPLLVAGEMRYRRLAIIIPEGDTTVRPTTHYTDTLDTQRDYARAKRLFPEANLMLFKPKTKNGSPVIVSVRNSVTGEVISGIEEGGSIPTKYPPDHL